MSEKIHIGEWPQNPAWTQTTTTQPYEPTPKTYRLKVGDVEAEAPTQAEAEEMVRRAFVARARQH